MRVLFALLLLLSGNTLFGQKEVYNSILSLPVEDEAKIEKVDSLLNLYIKNGEFNNVSVIGNSFANWHFMKKRFNNAIGTLQLAIEYDEKGSFSVQKKYHKLGQFYGKIDDHGSAIASYKKGIAIYADTVRTARIQASLGLTYYKLGDFVNSKLYYETAEKLFRKKQAFSRLIESHTNSYNTYSRINTSEARKKTISNLLEADSLLSSVSLSSKKKLNLKRALQSYYTDYNTRNISLSEFYGHQALDIAEARQDSIEISSIYNMLGSSYDQSNSKKAIEYNEKALTYNKKSIYNQGVTYANLGFNRVRLGLYEDGVSDFHKSLEFITGFDFSTADSIQIKNVLRQYYNDDNLWIIINNLAEAHLLQHENQSNAQALEKSLFYFSIADRIIDLFHLGTTERQSKLVWRRKATELYGRALRAAFLANDIDSAYKFMEKNKALLLYEENIKRQQLHNVSLNDSLISRKINLQNTILLLERNQKEATNGIALTQAKEALERLIDSIKIIHPEYTNVNIDYIPKTIAAIQESLPSDTFIVNYHIAVDAGFGIYKNQDKGYALFIGKDETYFFELDKTAFLKEQIFQLARQSTRPFYTEKEISSYKELSFALYKKLFPAAIRTKIRQKKLIIVPDNYLSNLSFESLSTSNESGKIKYLLYTNLISYHYSNTFHFRNAELADKHVYSQNISAFAPTNFELLNLPSLENSTSEISAIADSFSGSVFSEKEASSKVFTAILGQASIIHLATHANANDSIAPWIAFSDGKMYLDEISLSQNNASLVVLSACNTTLGEIATGEGVMSLARGFFYGGAQSTISSLWKVNDEATGFIMDKLYQNLAKGEAKAEALRNAKINYLNTHSGLESSPHYWASFVLIGDGGELILPTTNWLLIIGIAILIGIFCIAVSKVLRQSQTR